MAGATRSIVINAPIEKLFSIITDYEKYPQFLPEVKKIRLSNRNGNEVDVHYEAEIVKTINSLGGKARGFSGTDIFTCQQMFLDGPNGERLDIGFVGEVIKVNIEPLRECIRRGITPVISPTARGTDGKIYNCNADVAAAQAAIALGAKRLVFMSDVPGLLRNPKDPSTLIPHLLASFVVDRNSPNHPILAATLPASSSFRSA